MNWGWVIVGVYLCLGVRAKPKRSPLFIFTEDAYNITIEENSRGKVFAETERKMGVYLPHMRGTVKFKIVQGDEDNYFKAVTKQVGNFAYLRIRTQPNALTMALNRELKGMPHQVRHAYPGQLASLVKAQGKFLMAGLWLRYGALRAP